jgi:DNA-binding LacI/PurR family transcriptional regulator
MQEIARSANVSQATVSRVIRGNGNVSKETSQRVINAVSKMGYRGLGNLGDLAFHKRTGYIGLLIVGVSREILRFPQISNLVLALENALNKQGFMLVVNTSYGNSDSKLKRLFDRKRLDGVFVIGHPTDKTLCESLNSLYCVLLLGSAHRRGDPNWADWVTVNYIETGYLAADYLAGRGHKRLAFMNFTPENIGLSEARMGFNHACMTLGIEPILLQGSVKTERTIWDIKSSMKDIQDQCKHLMAIPKEERPTGIFVSECESAGVIYRELSDYGLTPGQDFEIISRTYDESYLSTISPRCAAIDFDNHRLVTLAIERLIACMRNPEAPRGVRVLVSPKVVPGD